jgi:uncharacterized protein (TIGR03437 family)
VNEDGSGNSADNPAAAGSAVLMYATGTGPTDPAVLDGEFPGTASSSVAPVRIEIGGEPAEVVYAGAAPGIVAGIIQINVRVPAGVTGTALPVLLQVGTTESQTGITISVQ